MSIAPAQPAINTLLRYGNGGSPETFTTLANVGDLTGPTVSATIVDVTSHSTGTPWREKIPTLLDGGNVSFPLFWIPSDSGHKAFLKFFTDRGQGGVAGVPINFKIVFPDSGATTYPFAGYVTKFNFDEKVADVIRGTIDITISGPITFPS